MYITIYNYDVICLSETYLDSSIPSDDNNLEIPGYDLIRVFETNPFLVITLADFNAKLSQWYKNDKTTTEGSKIANFTSQYLSNYKPTYSHT